MTITSGATTEAIHIGTYTPGSPDWHETRRSRLGGSEIAAVLGFSSYESHLSLWLRKKGLAADKPGSEVAEWGNRLEPAIFEKFSENHPVTNWRYQPGSYTHPERDWQLATPDGMAPTAPPSWR